MPIEGRILLALGSSTVDASDARGASTLLLGTWGRGLDERHGDSPATLSRKVYDVAAQVTHAERAVCVSGAAPDLRAVHRLSGRYNDTPLVGAGRSEAAAVFRIHPTPTMAKVVATTPNPVLLGRSLTVSTGPTSASTLVVAPTVAVDDATLPRAAKGVQKAVAVSVVGCASVSPIYVLGGLRHT